ncbi:uncharacterized protein LOC142073055 [Caretta caretta]|uniref:uncharacterized protein LOC142073055 n=1 Tax=Caretta caretta TaxID=8467 RepID=UPI003F4B1BC2
MTKSSARLQLELAKFQAEERQREHERQIELMRLEKEVQEAAHKREMEARKHVEEEKEKERKHVEEEKEKERKHVEEEKEKERKHVEEVERIKAQQNIPTNPSNPSPGTTSHPRKFPTYKAGDDTEAFLENFERACLGYNISTDQYMVELRPQLSGPLAEVAAEMPKEHMNKYELFKSKARVRMGITPEQSRRRFRALRWKPDMSFTRHAYHIVKHWDAWISGASVESPVNLPFLMQMEQFLEGVPEEIERYILDGKPKTVIEAGEIGARWVEVAEKKKTGRTSSSRWTVLKSYAKTTLKPLSIIRWKSKIESVKAMRFQTQGVQLALWKLRKTIKDTVTAEETSVPAERAEVRRKKLFSYKAKGQVIGDEEKRFKFDFFNIAIDPSLVKLGEHFELLQEHMSVMRKIL